MKYLKVLPFALMASLISQDALALGQATIDNAQAQARQDAIDRLAAADAAQKALVKKAAEEAAALAEKKAAEAAAKKAAEEAAAAKKAAEEAAAAEKAAAEAAAKKAAEGAAAKKAAEEEAARKAAEAAAAKKAAEEEAAHKAAEAAAAKKAAQKEAAKKAAEAAAAKKAAEEEAARNAGPEADALKAAGIEVNDSNKSAVKLLLDLNVQTTLITDANLKAILSETADLEKKAVALLIKTDLYGKQNNTSEKRQSPYSYRHAAEAFANNTQAWKVATKGDLKYWRKHASHKHNRHTVRNVAAGRHYN